MGGRVKAVVIVPGRRERVDSKAYKGIGELFEKKPIEPIYIQPDWRLKSVPDLLSDVSAKIEKSLKEEHEELYAFGFSMGAMIALMSSSHIKFKQLILCSMSFFKEEIPYMGIILRLFTEKLIYGGEEVLSYPGVIPGQEFLFVYGEKEMKRIPRQIIEARSKIFSSSEVVIAERAGHDIAHEGYQHILKAVIEKLR